MNAMERKIQTRLSRFLDGPDSFQLQALRRPGRYRSSALALFAWTCGFFRAFFSVPLLYLLPGILLLGFYGSVALEAPMRILLLVFLAIALCEVLFGWLFRPKVELRRLMPERVRVGSRFRVVFQVRNRRRFLPLWNVYADPVAYAPGLACRSVAGISCLAPGQCVTAEGEVEALRRGRYRIYRSRLESRFPFGLVTFFARGREAPRWLSVYPAFTELRSLQLPLGKQVQSRGTASYAKLGDSTDLYGVRDYRDGDDIRWIDWAGSARTGSFVVKEFEEEELKRVALVTDTFVPPTSFWAFRRTPRDYPVLEAALALAAAVTEFLSRGEAVIDLFAAGPCIYHLETGRNTGSFDAVCDILGALEPEFTPALTRLEPEVFRDLSATGGAVVILLGCDDQRRGFVERLRSGGVSLRVFLIAENVPEELPDGWTLLHPAEILNGQAVEL